MEEKKIATEEQAEQVEANEDPQVSQEKKFTQADVDRIIKDRLNRQKARDADTKDSENETKAQELAGVENELKQRENRLNCKEYLLDNNLPVGLLDVIDTSDSKSFQERIEKVLKMLGGRRGGIAPLASTEPPMRDGDVSAAFKNPAHKPKPFGVTDGDY